MGWTVYNSDGQILQGSSTLADDSVNSQHYVDGSIDNAHLADDAVGADELAANAVVDASVASNAQITFNKLATTTVSRILVSDGSGVISPSSVTTANLTDLTDSGATTLHSHAASGPTEGTQANIEEGITGTYYAPLDLIKYSPGVAKAYARIAGSNGAATQSYGLAACTRNSTGVYLINCDPDFDGAVMVPLAVLEGNGVNMAHCNRISDGTRWDLTVTNTGGTATDDDAFTVAWGELV